MEFPHQRASKRRLGPGALILAIVAYIAILMGEIKLAMILLALDFFLLALVIGYFGAIRKDLDNKYVNFLGGVDQFGRLPTTKEETRLSGYRHLVIGLIFAFVFLLLALIV